ncbi:MAG TPA: iron-containing alcohol dehydrogenase [Anaeromyxobacteraceae bacterium]|nr:iron-containing alcohol dehydrogenase [Anaeromyxobacteraceae bacterium]
MITQMSFPTRIAFGKGAIREVPGHLTELAVRHPLLVTDKPIAESGLLARLIAVLQGVKAPFTVFDGASANPTSETVERAADAYRRAGCDGLVAFGGGSSIDTAKGARLLASHEPPLARYDDAEDGCRLVVNPMPPLIAIPTTAGSGSEVGRSFVVVLPETGRKTVIFAPQLMPSVAVCDPELTYGLSPELTAATGMDAFTHNLEALCARGFHPLADALARKGIELCGRSLARAVRDGRDEEARASMMVAAITGGAAFQKGLGAAHALAHALTPIAGLHHGLANAIVLPFVMEFNLGAAASQLAEAAVALGELPTMEPERLARRAVERVRALAREVGIPERLRDAGVAERDLAAVAKKAFEDASHLLNPRPCQPSDLSALARAAF